MSHILVNSLFVFSSFLHLTIANIPQIPAGYQKLVYGDSYTINQTHQLVVFCNENHPEKSLSNVWASSYFKVLNKTSSVLVFKGNDVPQVIEGHEASKSWFYFGSKPQWNNFRQINFPLYRKYCVGIVGEEKPLVLEFVLKEFSYYRFALALFGLLCFYTASTISRSSVFHYSGGVLIGVCASVLLLLYWMAKFLPKKSTAVFFVVGGSTALYFFQFLWMQFLNFAYSYFNFLILYSLFSAFISLIFIYCKGPIKNPRVLNVVQWILQLFGLFCIFVSSEIYELTSSLALVVLVHYNISSKFAQRIRWRKPLHRFITEDEYRIQGRVETDKALTELRNYCSSPKCNAWKVISKLNNPARFARFVDGEPHVSEVELSMYEFRLFESEGLTDDTNSDNIDGGSVTDEVKV